MIDDMIVPAGRLRGEVHVDRLLRRRGPARDVAGPDAAQGARAVPGRRLLGDPDFLLIDMPPGTGDVALSMAQYLPSSEVYVVTTPQAAAGRVAQRSAYMAKKINLPLRGVIENMSWFTGDDGRRYELFGAGGGQQLAADLGVPLLGQIPFVTGPPGGRRRRCARHGHRRRGRGGPGLRCAGRRDRGQGTESGVPPGADHPLTGSRCGRSGRRRAASRSTRASRWRTLPLGRAACRTGGRNPAGVVWLARSRGSGRGQARRSRPSGGHRRCGGGGTCPSRAWTPPSGRRSDRSCPAT